MSIELLKGLIYTTGARYASPLIIKQAFTSLSNYLSQTSEAYATVLWRRILALAHPKTHPTTCEHALTTIENLLEAGVPVPPTLPLRAIFVTAHNASINTRNSVRVLAGISIFTSLASLGLRAALEKLVTGCLGRVGRGVCGAGLFTVLSEIACLDESEEDDEGGNRGVKALGISGEAAEEVCELIGDVDWTVSEDELKEVISKVKNILGI